LGTPALWIGFLVVVTVLIAVDLFVVSRGGGAVTPRQAGAWTLVWITLSVAFGIWIWWSHGVDKGVPFLMGYVVEYALSVDNLFVFLLIFSYFRIKPAHQHKLLYWGIVGAFVLRASLIVAGSALVARFTWLLYVFGAFLLYTAYKLMFGGGDDEVDPEKNPVLRLARKVLPVSTGDTGGNFVVRHGGKLLVTPLFLVLLVVETSDLLFALDSIPAVLGIIKGDSFLAFSSNVCAILGLRSLFFLVASLMDKFHYLKVGLSVILGFIGLKLIAETAFHVPDKYQGLLVVVSLGFIALVLGISVLVSVLRPPAKDHKVDAQQKVAGLDDEPEEKNREPGAIRVGSSESPCPPPPPTASRSPCAPPTGRSAARPSPASSPSCTRWRSPTWARTSPRCARATG
jgi:tellurite resistance protein TerC